MFKYLNIIEKLNKIFIPSIVGNNYINYEEFIKNFVDKIYNKYFIKKEFEL